MKKLLKLKSGANLDAKLEQFFLVLGKQPLNFYHIILIRSSPQFNGARFINKDDQQYCTVNLLQGLSRDISKLYPTYWEKYNIFIHVTSIVSSIMLVAQ